MHTLDELIVHSPVFEGLDQEELELIAGCGKNVAVPAGERLFREGDPANTFFLVRHGLVALDAYVPNRGQVTVVTIGPGEIVGWSWLVPPYVWRLTARVIEAVRVVEFDGACLRRKCEEDPVLGYDLLSRFAGDLADHLQSAYLQVIDVYGDRPS
jgi:CRP/FNR family transcriptional regulator, cyclic AMP receptor protein